VIDLIRKRVTQLITQKPVIRGIRVDPPEEILANKLCALLSRSEIRDLVDVRALEIAGYRVEDALQAAALKDTGLTPAQLSWVLSQRAASLSCGSHCQAVTFGRAKQPKQPAAPSSLTLLCA
jgi:hypothetical protein